MSYTIRRATPEDKPEWVRMRQGLWPDAPLEYLNFDLDELLANSDAGIFVASDSQGRLIGFIETGLRDHGEGCETSPVGYIEAWYVDPDMRKTGYGRRLLDRAEKWALAQGYTEMGSDALLENDVSHAAHRKCGYIEVDKVINYRKSLL